MPAFVTFNLDPVLSHVSISGDINGIAVTQQTPGSLTTTLQGGILVDLTSTRIRFYGAGVDADPQSGTFLPGNQPADLAVSGVLNGGTVYGAAENLQANAASGNLVLDTNGAFAANQLSLSLLSGIFRYDAPSVGYSGTNLWTSGFASNQVATAGTVTTLGPGKQLYVPVLINRSFYDPTLNATFNLQIQGEVYAYNFNPFAPTAQPDAFSVNEDGVLTVPAAGVLGNDSDPQATPLSAQLVQGPQHGSVLLGTNGSFVYTPNQNYFGTDSFTYRASDGVYSSAAAAVAITVTGTPDVPLGIADRYGVLQGGSLAIAAVQGVLSNDSDPDGDAITASLVANPTHGDLVFQSDGSFAYTPTPGYLGYDSFTYQPTDGVLPGESVTVTLAVNTPPTSMGESYDGTEDVPLIVTTGQGVLANDSDVVGDPLMALLIQGPMHGAVSLAADGSFVYTPGANYFGTDSFTYRANDGFADGAVTTVALVIGPVNDAPLAANDVYSIAEDGVLAVGGTGVRSNDTDVEGDPTTLVFGIGPLHGRLVWGGDGTFYYSPNRDFFGTDSFTYQLSDGQLLSNFATVTLNVTAVNDAPTAVNDAFSTSVSTTLVVAGAGVLGNDDDGDNAALSAQLVQGPSHGSVVLNADGSFTYSPQAGFSGSDSFVYRATDGATGYTLFTIDARTDELIAVDSLTGKTRVVGSIGWNVYNADLAYLNGVLYAVSSNSWDGTSTPGSTLLSIDPTTGHLLAAVAITKEGLAFNASGSLGAANGQLIVATNGMQTGLLNATTGVVSTVVASGSVNDWYDGFGTEINGKLLAVSTYPYSGSQRSIVFRAISTDRLTNNVVGGFIAPVYAPDVVVTPDGRAYVIDYTTRQILTLDAANGFTVLSTTQFNLDGASFQGVAFAPDLQAEMATVTIAVGSTGGTSGTAPAPSPETGGAVVTGTGPGIGGGPSGAGATNDSYVINGGGTLVVPGAGVLQNDGGQPTTAALIDGPKHGSLVFHTDGSFSYTPHAGYSGTDHFEYRAGSGTTGLEFYSINTATDELIKIDSGSGAVTVIGAIGHDMNRVGMTFLGNTLYVINSNTPDVYGNPGYTLVAIDPTTGAKLSSITVTANGQPVRVAFGLTASEDGRLFLSYEPNGLSARTVGVVDPTTGVVTPVYTTNGIQTYGNDLHAIAFDKSGRLFGIYNESLNGTVILWAIINEPFQLMQASNYGLSGPYAGVYEFEFANDSFYLLDTTRKSIDILNGATGAYEGSLPLSVAYTTSMQGFAFSAAFQSNRATVSIEIPAAQPPTASVTGPTSGVRGQPRQFTLLANDSSAVDQVKGFTFQVDWNSDGIVDQIVVGPSGTTVEHIFTQSGAYTFQVRAVDEGGLTSAWLSRSVTVTDWALQIDPVNSSKTNLVWGGTNGTDAYGFVPGGLVAIQAVNNQFFFQPQFVFTGAFNGKLIVYAQGGSDLLFADVMNLPVELHGGDGDDILVGGRAGDWLDGGAGNDILLGGTLDTDGNDTIFGGAGDDLIVGSYGADWLYGGSGQDMIVAGRLSYSSLPSAIYSIQAEWLSGRPYAERVANLTGPGSVNRFNGEIFLTPASTALDDSAVDRLFGEEDQDWLIMNEVQDLATDFDGSLEVATLVGTV